MNIDELEAMNTRERDALACKIELELVRPVKDYEWPKRALDAIAPPLSPAVEPIRVRAPDRSRVVHAVRAAAGAVARGEDGPERVRVAPIVPIIKRSPVSMPFHREKFDPDAVKQRAGEGF